MLVQLPHLFRLGNQLGYNIQVSVVLIIIILTLLLLHYGVCGKSALSLLHNFHSPT